MAASDEGEEAKTVVQTTPTPTSASKRTIAVGDVLNHMFEVKRFIKAGGVGQVFEGSNVMTGERVAIKALLPALAADPKVIALFQREATTLTRLNHEALVQYRTLAKEPQSGILYIVTEFIDGVELGESLGQIDRSEEEVRHLMERLASGLAAAHKLGAIHRDMSLDNVMLPGGDIHKAKIIDFGIAKDTESALQTLIGSAFAGKLNYVAPEQLGDHGGEIGPWTDVYSLALVMLAVAGGKKVDMAGSFADAIHKRREGVDVSAAPESLRPLLAAMLKPNPAERMRSMVEVLATLGEAAEAEETARKTAEAVAAARAAVEADRIAREAAAAEQAARDAAEAERVAREAAEAAEAERVAQEAAAAEQAAREAAEAERAAQEAAAAEQAAREAEEAERAAREAAAAEQAAREAAEAERVAREAEEAERAAQEAAAAEQAAREAAEAERAAREAEEAERAAQEAAAEQAAREAAEAEQAARDAAEAERVAREAAEAEQAAREAEEAQRAAQEAAAAEQAAREAAEAERAAHEAAEAERAAQEAAAAQQAAREAAEAERAAQDAAAAELAAREAAEAEQAAHEAAEADRAAQESAAAEQAAHEAAEAERIAQEAAAAEQAARDAAVAEWTAQEAAEREMAANVLGEAPPPAPAKPEFAPIPEAALTQVVAAPNVQEAAAAPRRRSILPILIILVVIAAAAGLWFYRPWTMLMPAPAAPTAPAAPPQAAPAPIPAAPAPAPAPGPAAPADRSWLFGRWCTIGGAGGREAAWTITQQGEQIIVAYPGGTQTETISRTAPGEITTNDATYRRTPSGDGLTVEEPGTPPQQFGKCQ